MRIEDLELAKKYNKKIEYYQKLKSFLDSKAITEITYKKNKFIIT